MNLTLRRAIQVTLVTMVVFVCSISTANAQLTSQNTKTLSVRSASTTEIVYTLNLVNPEVAVDAVIKEFLGKTGIKSCTANGSQLTIVTESEITHRHIMDIAEVAGCRNTSRAYREEIIGNRPVKEIREDLK